MANDFEQHEENKSLWPSDQLLRGFKELVTALIGLAVVLYTLTLATRALSLAGQPQAMSDAKDVLMLVLGLTGVVIGYYFGRVPADARADQAQNQANAATAQAEQIGAQAGVLADQVDQVLDKLPAPPAAAERAAAGAQATISAELQQVRDRLRGLAAQGRRAR